MFVLAVVLLAQAVVPPSDEAPDVPSGDIAGSLKRWEDEFGLSKVLKRWRRERCRLLLWARCYSYGARSAGMVLEAEWDWIEWDMCPRR